MDRAISSRRGLMLLVLCLVLVIGLGVIGLAASSPASGAMQEQEQENQTEPEQEIAEQLGDLVVHSYDFERNSDETGGTFSVSMTWTGKAPEQLTMTEMLELDSGGATEISFQQQRLRPGEKTEITMNAEIRSGGTAAIMLTTVESVENGNALVLQDGDPRERPAIRMQNVILAMGLSSGLTAIGAFVFVLRRKHDSEFGADRIA